MNTLELIKVLTWFYRIEPTIFATKEACDVTVRVRAQFNTDPGAENHKTEKKALTNALPIREDKVYRQKLAL